MNISIAQIVETLEHVAGKDIELAYLFGSHAINRANKHSDIDIAILPHAPITAERIWEWAQHMAAQLGKDVDLINLMDCNTVLRMQIVQEGQLLLDRNNKAPSFETDTYRMYQDLQFSRQDNLDAFKQRWTETNR